MQRVVGDTYIMAVINQIRSTRGLEKRAHIILIVCVRWSHTSCAIYKNMSNATKDDKQATNQSSELVRQRGHLMVLANNLNLQLAYNLDAHTKLHTKVMDPSVVR